ncbi:MAG: ABC transporter substrate-binding protein [Deltaproteobacteria bacterium]|nr:ABC transporter substrate-binding protein [Deltaproteobacteria bacterium]
MNRVARLSLLLICIIATSPVAARVCAAEKSVKLIPIRIAVVSRGTLDLPFWVARERGFFRDEGIDAEIILFKASLTVQATLGGSIDFGTATGTALSAAVNGADVRVVMAMSERPSFDLMGHASIASISQLRGKRIGFGGVGGLPELIIRQILLANQIPVDQVTFLSLGGGDVSYMSLRAGVIDAVMLQIPNTFVAQDEGFRKVASGGDYYRAVQGGLAVTKALLSEKPEVVTKVIRATLRALRLLKNDKRYAVETLIQKNYVELGKERERFAERAYEAAVQGYSLTGIIDEKLQREMIATAAQRVKPPPQIAPERVFDFTMARNAGEGLR